MKPAIYLLLALLLLLFSYIVFRRIVRRDYSARSRLSAFASIIQLLVFIAYFSFPYLFNPAEWPWFWKFSGSATRAWQLSGLALICFGFIIAFGTMAWFGIGKAFGLNVDGLISKGPYRISRNPQILGGYLLVIGVSLQWPSLYSIGWILMYAIISHWMVITEEEHLSRVYSEEFVKYCAEVPRYLFGPKKKKRAST